jgi:excisionase family DNA binding protein
MDMASDGVKRRPEQYERYKQDAAGVMPKTSGKSALLDKLDAAEYLNVSVRSVDRLWADRKLSGVKVGGLVRFRQKDLDAYIERHRQDAIR